MTIFEAYSRRFEIPADSNCQDDFFYILNFFPLYRYTNKSRIANARDWDFK